MKQKFTARFAMTLAAMAAMSPLALGQIQITDQAGLAAMAENPSGEYELASDIVLTGTWQPVGSESAPFTGKLDGKGHTISGLYVTNPSWSGLFGCISGGSVSNLVIAQAYVKTDEKQGEHVGILAGRAGQGTTISGVFTSGYVFGRDHVGGIVGDAGEGSATVTNCMSTAYVYSTSYQAGGIAGWSKGTVTIANNLFLGRVFNGGFGGSGGIVGFVEDGTTKVSGNVCAASTIVGPTGERPMQIGKRYANGIVGTIYNENSILEASDNLVSKETQVYNQSNELQDVSDWEETYHGIKTEVAVLQTAATYTGLGWDDAVWDLADGRYPVLKGMTLPIPGDYIQIAEPAEVYYVQNVFDTKAVSALNRAIKLTSSDPAVATVDSLKVNFVGAGTATITLTTADDAFSKGATKTFTANVSALSNEIATAADIENIRKNPQGDFVLTADIDMSDVDFKPINSFSGSIDGQGHFIRNLRFEDKDVNEAAFIGTFDGTSIKNLGFENAYIVGNANTAIVVGKTSSASVIDGVVVMNSYAQGRDHVAAFVGNLDGGATISNCLSNATLVTREYQLGAIAGVSNHGTIEHCVFTGTLAKNSGATNVGLVGLLDSDSNPTVIKNNLFAAAFANGCSGAGLIIVPAGRTCTLTNNYVAKYTLKDGAPYEGADADSDAGKTATKEEVRSQNWYTTTLGFDFENSWKFLTDAEGHMVPVLKWMNAPLTTTLLNMPGEDGVTIAFIEGTEKYDYNVIRGSWGEDITVEQLDGFEYASIVEEEGGTSLIYAGDENGEYKGKGSAHFKVNIDPALANALTVSGDVTFAVNVYKAGSSMEIASAEDFMGISKAPGSKYVLTADIDFSGVEFNGLFNDGISSFTGELDGQGHSVKNFKLTFTEDENKGLFGKTQNAVIKNIAFTDFVIDGGVKGAKHVGLIGQGSATLEEVAVVGKVIGYDHVGLVAGDSDGIVMNNCYAVGTVEAGSQAGGFFGCTLEGGAEVTNCLTNVNVNCSFRGWSGGVVGLIDKANSTVTVKNCASIGTMSSTGDGNPHVAAPFIAGNGAGDNALAVINFSNNIYNSTAAHVGDTQWPGKNLTAEGGAVTEATAVSPAALQQQASYTTIGWDFDNVWSMGQGDYLYPVLKKVNVTNFSSGVEDLVADATANVRVYTNGTEVTVDGFTGAAVVNIYNVYGATVAAASTAGESVSVNVPAAGVYVVSVVANGQKVFKILVR